MDNTAQGDRFFECSCGSTTMLSRPECHGCLKPIPDPLPALLRRADEALKRATERAPDRTGGCNCDECKAIRAKEPCMGALIDLAAILKEMGPR